MSTDTPVAPRDNIRRPGRHCPVCWKPVRRAKGTASIGAHRDTVGSLCRGGGEPYYITITASRMRGAA